MGQEFWHSLVRCLWPRCLTRLLSRIRWDHGLIQRPAPERTDLLLSSLVWFFARFGSLWAIGPRASVPCWLLARGPHISLPPEPFTGQLIAWQLASLKARENTQNRSQNLLISVSELTSHQVHCILFSRSKSPNPARTQGDGAGIPGDKDHWLP